MISSPVNIPLPYETVATLEEELGPWVRGDCLALPDVEHLALGSVVNVVLQLTDGSAVLSLRAFVEWRHPAASPPPGHAARTGLAVLAVEEASTGMWRRLVALSEGQAAADTVLGHNTAVGRPPRVPRLEPRWRLTPVDEHSAAKRRALSEDRVTRARQHFRGPPRDATPAARSVPPPGALPADPLPSPELSGAAFLFEYPGRGLEAAVGRLERFGWPLIGTLRPSRSDVRTAHAARVPGGPPPDDDDLEVLPVEEPSTRAAPLPQSRPPDPPRLASEPDDDVTLTDDATGGTAESTAARMPQGQRLSVGLFLRVGSGHATLLLPAGHLLPATVESRIPVDEGRAEVTASVFEGDGESVSLHLWTGSIGARRGAGDVVVRLELDDEGVLRLRSPDDDGLRVELHVTRGARGNRAAHRQSRPWWQRILRG